VLRGGQTGVCGRKFAGCGYVDGGVRGISARSGLRPALVSISAFQPHAFRRYSLRYTSPFEASRRHLDLF
jgi:hypothetical protein